MKDDYSKQRWAIFIFERDEYKHIKGYWGQMERQAKMQLFDIFQRDVVENNEYLFSIEHHVVEFDPLLRGTRHEYVLTAQRLKQYYHGA